MRYKGIMKTTPPNSSDVRQWARQKGLEVGERGRLSPDVLAAYSAAHGGPPVKAPAKKAAKKTARKATKAPARTAAKDVRSAPAATPVVALESARVEALESKLVALSARIERLEAARAAAPAKRGLFGRKN
ncbi:MAG: Lsr2 [Frankiales bacterium]|nr:Lsr2 [Frankiales bacterium]